MISKDKMPADHLKVYNIIYNAPYKYINREKILKTLGRDEKYTRRLVDIIHSLIVDYAAPIGASAEKNKKGYFIIQNEADKALAVKTLTSRISGIKKRADALNRIAVSEKEIAE